MHARETEREVAEHDYAQVRVRVAAVGLNFADLFTCLGLYNAAPKTDFVPGLEFSGVVDATGPECYRGLKVGDRVIGVTRFGAYTTHLNVNDILVRPHILAHDVHGGRG